MSDLFNLTETGSLLTLQSPVQEECKKSFFLSSQAPFFCLGNLVLLFRNLIFSSSSALNSTQAEPD